MSLWSRLFGEKSLNEPATVTVAPDIVQSFRYWGSSWDGYGRIYERQPAVRTVVDFLAKNIAQLKPKVYLREGDSRVEIPGHRLAVLLQRPNEATTPFRHWRDTVADIGIYDRAYWRKIRVNGLLRFVERIPPSRVTLEVDDRTQRRIYRLADGRGLSRDDLVIFSGYHPDGDEDGVSPLETLRRVLAEEWAATNHRENFWKNAARQSGVIQRPMEAPEWGDVARERFRKDWQSSMAGGQNAGKTAILEEGMTWNTAAFSPRESEYIEGRKLTYQEVARAYAPSLVGLLSDEAKANVESYHRQLYQDVLAPITRSLEDEIELQLLPEFEKNAFLGNIYVEFNLAEKLRGSFEEQARSLVTAVGVPYLGVNEARSMLNKPRIDDSALDMPVKPMNVMYGNQPAVTVPTEDPGTRLRSSVPKVKAIPLGPQRRRDLAAEQFQSVLAAFFAHQERSIVSSLGGKKALPELRSLARWDQELIGQLEGRSQLLVSSTGKTAAAQLRGVFNPALTVGFVEERTRIAAETINQTTFDDLDEAFDDEGLDGVRRVFEEAKTSRAERLAFGTVTGLIAFARTDAAKQSQQADGRLRSKTWIVTSGKSRHPELDGETVPVFEPFSNGAAWPGDPTLGADGTAGCKCLLALE